MLLERLPVFAISIQRCHIHWFYINVIAAKSNIEKQIGFTQGNFYNPSLAFKLFASKTWLSTRNRIFFSTSIDTTLAVQVLPNRKSLDFDYLKSRHILPKFSVNLSSGAGSPGWSRTRPKLVCCEAWWLHSNKKINTKIIVLCLTF